MGGKGRGSAAIMLSAWCVLVAVMLFKGYSGIMLSMIPLAAAAGLSRRADVFTVVFMTMALAFVSPGAMAWAALFGGSFCAFSGGGTAVRTAGFLACAVALWFTPIQSAIPLAVVPAAGVLFFRHRITAYLVLLSGFFISVFLTGLPRLSEGIPANASSFIDNGTIVYEVNDLNSFRREIRLPAPCSGIWAMWVSVDCGGVRDTLPMMAVCLNDEILVLPPGRDTLCFTMTPGDTLNLALLREYRPFNHPVVHISAGGEKI